MPASLPPELFQPALPGSKLLHFPLLMTLFPVDKRLI